LLSLTLEFAINQRMSKKKIAPKVIQKVVRKAAGKAAPKKIVKTIRKSTSKAEPKPFKSTGFWLMKSEPESYSIDQLSRDGKTFWTGVRNYQARNFMMNSMQKGDRFLFYHSNAEPTAIVGQGEIFRTSMPDTTALDKNSDYYDAKASTDHPIWFCAEVGFIEKFSHPFELSEIRQTKELSDMPLLRPGQRLSIQPVSAAEFKFILKKCGARK
jgi:predicted RNA-binding protein with PUA-like domain